MLILTSAVAAAIMEHAEASHPLECCGIVASRPEARPPYRLIPMRNMAQSEDYFEFAPLEQLAAWRGMDAAGEAPLVFYHSHTRSAAYPSRSDVAHAAAYPEVHHLIVATDPRFQPPLRSYRIVDGRVSEEPVAVLGADGAVTPIALSTPYVEG